ncbi:probable protein phosphatase 2C 25 [Malania oleifera]|uniref:probable protein phosphatase 2C 25 n=1 Tax=Malania oleifera TaxID=397392 RepID=UPI0025ADCE00|nr:probable protein phosphatase 2C 25 [Malania oleifera]
MAGAVALANSPVFSPRVPPIFCKTPSSPSPELVKSPTASFLFSSPPPSPLTLRLQKQLTGLRDRTQEASASPSAASVSSTILKRKRPAKINVPIAPLSLLAVETPAVVDALDEMEAAGDGYSVYCKRGRRAVMEDRYSAVVNIHGDSKQAFFGVFDGHGGEKAAEFAAKNLDRNIMEEVTRCEEKIEDAIKSGYLTTDAEFLKGDLVGGTCCVTALIHKGDLVVSNAGDCRAVMSQGGVAEAVTSDHRPSREDERDRIENLGGYVDCCRGVWRIQGSLAVSRGIGDPHLKKWVIAEPDTKIIKISSECEFIILASDGLWDKVMNQEAVDMVRSLCIGVDKPEPLSACKNLAELSVSRGSADDVTVMVIQLDGFVL